MGKIVFVNPMLRILDSLSYKQVAPFVVNLSPGMPYWCVPSVLNLVLQEQSSLLINIISETVGTSFLCEQR